MAPRFRLLVAPIPPHRRKLGFVFQDLALWPHLTVRQNLDFVLGSMALSRPEQDRRAHDALALVRIEELAGRYPHQLSGGEQQRVALARAIVLSLACCCWTSPSRAWTQNSAQTCDRNSPGFSARSV